MAERGFIKVKEHYQTTNPKIFAVGDAVKIELLTEAIRAVGSALGLVHVVSGI